MPVWDRRSELPSTAFKDERNAFRALLATDCQPCPLRARCVAERSAPGPPQPRGDLAQAALKPPRRPRLWRAWKAAVLAEESTGAGDGAAVASLGRFCCFRG